jgi:Flp pilus assembly pilin Flp
MYTQLASLVGGILFRDEEDGQGLAEDALILALIAIVAIVALIFLGGQVSGKLSTVGGAL